MRVVTAMTAVMSTENAATVLGKMTRLSRESALKRIAALPRGGNLQARTTGKGYTVNVSHKEGQIQINVHFGRGVYWTYAENVNQAFLGAGITPTEKTSNK